MLYRRGDVWWWKFQFAGRTFRESAKTSSKDVARRAELKRRRDLEESYHGLGKPKVAPLALSTAAAKWVELKTPTLAAKSLVIEKTSLSHLLPVLGRLLLSDISAEDIARYQEHRLKQPARPGSARLTSPKTVNLEIGTLRAILKRHRLWANIQPDVRMLPAREDVGIALSLGAERELLNACAESRSRSLLPAVLVALNTGMRYSEIRLLQWRQVDLNTRTLTVGRSKTQAGTGRVVPLNAAATEILRFWADQFPKRETQHHVFPSEKYGAGGDDFKPTVHATDPRHPIASWKEAWESAKKRAGVSVRFHDLRHTCVTRMLEAGVPLSVVASVMGWSSATTVRMVKRYGHIGQAAQRLAVEALDRPAKPEAKSTRGGHKNRHTDCPEKVERRKTLGKIGSSGWIRTSNPPVNSRMLCR